MPLRFQPAVVTILMLSLVAEGCSTLREIPRTDLADLPEQRDVVVDLRSGEHYDFESARFSADSLWGFKRTEEESSIPELSTTPLALDAVARVSSRRLDWYRTGLAAAGVLTGGVAYAISQHRSSNSGDGGTPVKPPPTLAGSSRR